MVLLNVGLLTLDATDQPVVILADAMNWLITRSILIPAMHLVHLGLNQPMILADVGKVFMVLSSVMKHSDSLVYLTATA